MAEHDSWRRVARGWHQLWKRKPVAWVLALRWRHLARYLSDGGQARELSRRMTQPWRQLTLGIRRDRRLAAAVLVLIVVTMGAGLAAGALFQIVQAMPAVTDDELPLAPVASLLYDANDLEVARFYEENRVPVALDEVPGHAQAAFLAAEDARFHRHLGVDPVAIMRAAVANYRGDGIVEGGSTITQQLARNAFPEIGHDRTLQRKLHEAVMAVHLERRYTKDEILEAYVNRVYFGQGAYGVGTAAGTYFDKEVWELTLAESTLLAGLLVAPSRYSPHVNPAAAEQRRTMVLDRMLAGRSITPEEYAEARSVPVAELVVPPATHAVTYPHPWYVDAVFQELIAWLSLQYREEGLSREEARAHTEAMIFTGGLKVYTALEPELQEAAEQAVRDVLDPIDPPDGEGPLQAAVVLMEPETGYVRALVGGRQHAGLHAFIRATDARRHPGSAFKPVIAYGPALAAGLGPATVLDDAPRIYSDGWTDDWAPRNADHRFAGLITAREALRRSVNVATVRLVEQLGVERALDYAQRIGIENLVTEPVAGLSDGNLAVSLGALTYGVTPLELNRAYATFANGGYRVEPILIHRIEGRDGSILLEREPRRERVISTQEAYLMTDMLRSAVRNQPGPWQRDGYTGWRAVQGSVLGEWDVAGKTGTADDISDIWFVGYTTEYVATVWLGYDGGGGSQRTPVVVGGVNGFGGLWPAMIWNRLMSEVHTPLEPAAFSRPDGLVELTVCIKSGLPPGPGCPSSFQRTELFIEGTEPQDEDEAFVRLTVVPVDGRRLAASAAITSRDPHIANRPYVLPDDSCPSSSRVQRWFLNRPAVDLGEVRRFTQLVYENQRTWQSQLPLDLQYAPPLLTCSDVGARPVPRDLPTRAGVQEGENVQVAMVIGEREVWPSRIDLVQGQRLELQLENFRLDTVTLSLDGRVLLRLALGESGSLSFHAEETGRTNLHIRGDGGRDLSVRIDVRRP